MCARLKSFRESLKWRQRDFAEKIGITKTRLASYEYGRAPIRYWLARKLTQEFHLSPVWLATGQPPMTGYLVLDAKVEQTISDRALLSEVYHDHFIGSIEMDMAMDVKTTPRFEPIVYGVSDRIEILLQDYLDVVERLLQTYQGGKGKKAQKQSTAEAFRRLEELESDLRAQVRKAIANRPAFMRALIASLGAAPTSQPQNLPPGAK